LKRKERRRKKKAAAALKALEPVTPKPSPALKPPNSKSSEETKEPILTPEHLADLQKSIDVVHQLKNVIKPIKKTSVASQINRVNRLMRWSVDVTDTDATMAFIATKKWKPNTRNGYLQALASILVVFPMYQEQYEFYSEKSIEGRKIITEEDDKCLVPEDSNWANWDDVNQLYLMAPDGEDKALMALYTLLPPRRVGDVAILRLGTGANHLSSDLTSLTYSVYKTSKTYGKIIIAVPKPLQRVFKAAFSDLVDGDQLFPGHKNFSRHVSTVFGRYSDKKVTANILRHAFITQLKSTKQSTSKLKLVGKLMGHSIHTQQAYVRVNL
jgi:hypothetical protein